MASPAATLDTALPCIDCGYDLRGLSTSQTCPECGAAVERSTRGDRLCFANPRWLGKVKWGVELVGVGVALYAALDLLFDAIIMVLIGLSIQQFALWMTLATGMFLIGLWLIAATEPRHATDGWSRTLRLIVRYTVAVQVTILIGFKVLESLGPDMGAPGYTALRAGLNLVLSVAIVATLLILRDLASRMASRALHALALLALALTTLSAILGLVDSALTIRNEEESSLEIVWHFLAAWVTSPVLTILFLSFFLTLHRQHRLARENALAHV